ncbi:isoleucine--tRNA ligase [Elusimicrobiota bacterium]
MTLEKEKKDYSKSVNLPFTDFQMKANLPTREPEFIKLWQDIGLYKNIQKINKGKKKFILHDGPPYANGHIHLGTSLNKILKDFVVKHKSMSGFHSPYTPGWDCHGLPIEQQCMKALKTDKNKVDKLKFRYQASDFAKKFVDIQKTEFMRLGVLSDWDKPYLTLDHKYEGTIARVFGQLAKSGYVYRQKKPVYWCPTCETALADAEVEYDNHTSHSIYAKFEILKLSNKLKDKIKLEGKSSVLIWTTTPWTLPANVALAFLSHAEYVFVNVQHENNTNENLIVSKKLLLSVIEKSKIKSHKIIHTFSGDEVEGIVCRNPVVERESVGILAGFVSLEDGTGIVHIAPGHGHDDYIAGLQYNLPIISPVNDWGGFTDEVKEFAGKKVFAANDLILEKLKNTNKLIFDEKIQHSYPHCWRCKKPIIFRATPQWFLNVEAKNLRKNILDKIKTVKWIPPYGEKRISGMMEVRPDWCLSRQRLWGVPIPVFYCDKCNEPILDDKIIDYISNLFYEKGANVWYEKTETELLEQFKPSCTKCQNTKFRKEQDILDVWFDSGVSSEAVLASGDFEDLSLPADMYLEGSDQHRGWFQTSLIPAVALRNNPPYKTVLTHGFVVDGEGKKMSKSLGNVIAPEEIIKKFGADILRLWVAASDYREDIRISDEIIKGLVDTYRKIRNTIRFILGNLSDFTDKNALEYNNLNEIDKYALHKLQEVTKQVTNAFESYEFHKAAISINNFCTVFLSGFYLDALKDSLYCDVPDSKNRRSAQTAFLEISSVLTRLLSPILSFTCEEAWQELRKKYPELSESVFLADYPAFDKNYLMPENIKNKWDKLLGLKQTCMQEIEKLRRDKTIGSALEAAMEIKYGTNNAAFFDNKEIIHMVIGSWDINLNEITEKTDQLIVSAKGKSTHKKCDRCWRYINGINENGLCPRCVSALNENKKH